MKLGNVLAALSAAALVASQPAFAETRSASSLPAVGAKVESVKGRVGSRTGESESFLVGGIPIILITGLFMTSLFFVVIRSNNDFVQDAIDKDLPKSP